MKHGQEPEFHDKGMRPDAVDEPSSAQDHADKALSPDDLEWLDIVDEHDCVIGRAPRSVVHAEGHLHRSTHIVIGNSEGCVFIQLRSVHKGNSPGLWDSSAAGHVDSGEGYRHCASREIGEELGVQVAAEALRYCGRLDPFERNSEEFTEVYVAHSDDSMTLREGEVDDGRWLRPEEVDAWLASEPGVFTRTFPLVWAMVRHCFEPGQSR